MLGQITQHAISIHEIYISFIEAGFTKGQAFELIAIYYQSICEKVNA